MTPLFAKIVKELTLPKKRRTFVDQCGLLEQLGDVHCFEVTACIEAAGALLEKVAAEGLGEHLGFLPAPKTWIEWKIPSGETVGYLLDGTKRPTSPKFEMAWHMPHNGSFKSAKTDHNAEYLCLQSRKTKIAPGSGEKYLSETRHAAIGLLLPILAMINTPRVIGRRQHNPHRGLEKRLLKSRAVVGQFPLHAWTEIILEVTPPSDEAGEPPREARLTGEKALHFVRAHLRIWDGRLILVQAHWRGNKRLGIVRSRYKLRPPKNGPVIWSPL